MRKYIKQKLYILPFLLIFVFLTNVLGQCPLYEDVLNQGYNSHLPGSQCPAPNGNYDEFGVVDDESFMLKLGTYPPVKALPDETSCEFFYFSFDTDDDYVPINYRMLPHEQSIVKTYRIDENYNYVNGAQVTIEPPIDSDVGGIPDFLMKYNGTKHDLAWEESQYPAWEWSDFVSAPITYTPTAPNVEIVGVDEMNQNTTTEFIADINGGGGKYGIYL
ncbi:MAG: hypothetical protein KDF60_17685 [Calditrichaeota bacterium]|nr:hypothetical protein [Calditrichota bacterium]